MCAQLRSVTNIFFLFLLNYWTIFVEFFIFASASAVPFGGVKALKPRSWASPCSTSAQTDQDRFGRKAKGKDFDLKMKLMKILCVLCVVINCSKKNSCISTGHDELYTLSFEAHMYSVTPTYIEKYFVAGNPVDNFWPHGQPRGVAFRYAASRKNVTFVAARLCLHYGTAVKMTPRMNICCGYSHGRRAAMDCGDWEAINWKQGTWIFAAIRDFLRQHRRPWPYF